MKHARFTIFIWGMALVVGLLSALPAGAKSSSVNYGVYWLHRTRVHVISIDLQDQSLLVTPALAYDTLGRRQSFLGFMAQHQPLAQITGSYFSLSDALPIGDIVIGGRRRFAGPVGSALAIKPDNTAEIINIPFGWRYSWPGYESALKGGIRLVQNGKFAVYPRDQGFRDPALFRRATRTAVGLKAGPRLLMVAVNKPVYLSDMAAIMKALGCTDAMALDGGTSTGLAYGNNVILSPGRTLSNVLMVVQRPEPSAPAVPVTPVTPTLEAPAAVLAQPVPPPTRLGMPPPPWSLLPPSLVNLWRFRYSSIPATPELARPLRPFMPPAGWAPLWPFTGEISRLPLARSRPRG